MYSNVGHLLDTDSPASIRENLTMVRLPAASLILCLSFGCSKPADTQGVASTTGPAAERTNPGASEDVSYKIMKDERTKFPERDTQYVDFRLTKRVSKEKLGEIAREVMAKDPYRRVVSFYYLPKMIEDAAESPWASTDYRPTLEVEILGLTIEQYAALETMKLDLPGKLLGKWILPNQFNYLFMIYEYNGVVYLTQAFPNGNRDDSQLVELPSTAGRRFKTKNSTEVICIDSFGNLRCTNEKGVVFAAATPLK